MKRTVSQIVSILNLVATAKIAELTGEEKSQFIKLLLSMRAEAKKWDEYIAEVRKQCAPENLEALEALVREAGDGEPTEEVTNAKAELDKFYAEVNKVAQGEFASEREVGEPLTAEAFEHLTASNPQWEVSTILALHDLLSE